MRGQSQGAWIVLAGLLCFTGGIYAAPWVLGLHPEPAPPWTPAPLLLGLDPEPALTSTPAPFQDPARAGPPEDLSALYRRLSPTVVSISATQVEGSVRPAWSAAERFFYGPVIDTRRQTQVRGSGFLLSAEGEIITNHHVIQNASSIKIAFADGTTQNATLVGSDPATDIALLRSESPPSVQPVVLGNSDTIQVGQPVLAIGNPFGLGHSLTTGVISYKGRSLSDTQGLVELIQTDMPINHGNSGGPVFDRLGRVVGINTSILKDAQGISFAIPVNAVKTVSKVLREKGKFERGVLGVTFAYPPDGAPGVALESVVQGLPAEAAGVLAGDRVLAIDGKTVNTFNEYRTALALTPLGSSVSLLLLRGDTEHSIEVELAPAPDLRRYP